MSFICTSTCVGWSSILMLITKRQWPETARGRDQGCDRLKEMGGRTKGQMISNAIWTVSKREVKIHPKLIFGFLLLTHCTMPIHACLQEHFYPSKSMSLYWIGMGIYKVINDSASIPFNDLGSLMSLLVVLRKKV